jgi:hypothetical protein
MKVEELFEGISNVLYHSTGIMQAASIIEDNRFILSADFAKDAEMKSGKPMFYLSTTRSRAGSYHNSENSMFNGTVIFVLDGRKLAQTYAGKPVDYWGDSFRNEHGVPLNDEMEDRIFSPTRTIPALKYIMSVDIMMKEPRRSTFSDEPMKDTHRGLNKLIFAAKRAGVPVRVFDTQSTMLTGRNPAGLGAVVNRSEGSPMFGDAPSRRYKPYETDALRNLILIGEMLLKGKRPTKEMMFFFTGPYGYNNPYYRKEMIGKLKNDMFNETKRESMQKLRTLMVKFRVGNVIDLAEAIHAEVERLGYLE